MVNNIKAEIIYHLLPTDFEFEFNLGGCCQMRQLKKSVNDNNELLQVLSRAITRSRIIIIVGNVQGDDNNIIKLISKAIGYECNPIDNSVYEVNSPEDIFLIDNAVPLITDAGIFGGCIIESGPQSMIFLTSNKAIRRELMDSLVHPYIAALSKYPIITAEITNELPEEIPETEPEKAPIETDIPEMNAEKTPQAEADYKPQPEFEDISSGFEDISSGNEIMDDYELERIERFKDQDSLEPDEDEIYYDMPRNGNSLRTASLIIAIILLLLLAYIIYGFVYQPLSEGISITENFKELFSVFYDM